MNLTLIIGGMSVVKWWVDYSYTVHTNLQGHTGSMVSLVKGTVSVFSTKQNIDIKRSTRDNLIGVDETMYNILWSKYII